MLPEALRFQVGLVDQISKPLGNIQRQFSEVTSAYQSGTHSMIAGAAGVAGAGFALQAALMPAIEMDRALGEVKSLGVTDDALQQLSNTALDFAVEYGKSADQFVAASYDIQSGIAGLNGMELSQFTKASGVLAAATKADTATITDYMGTMYGIFKNDAAAMTKGVWVEQLTGMTASAVQMFKTDGTKMSQAFASLGADATSAQIAMSEQMAVMGTLQSTMSGSEAGTKYRAFLGGVAKAQDHLNMTFTDSQGTMLPMLDILKDLKGRYGETIDVAESAELAKAFGTKEATAMVKLLIADTNGLANSINQLENVKGMTIAEKMAGAMTDQWERLEQGVFVVRAAFGQALLPAILPVVGAMADGAKGIVTWTQTFPNLTRYIGFAGVALLGAVAAGGMFTLMMGVGKQVMATYMLTMKIFTGVNFLLTKGMTALRAAVFAANLVIAANPIVLVIGAAVAAVAAIGALVYYWDDLKASFGDTTWFQILDDAVQLITLPFRTFFNFLRAGWQWVMSGFTDVSGFAFIGEMADQMRNIFGSVFDWFTSSLAGMWDSVKGMVDWIPGIGGDEIESVSRIEAVQKAKPKVQVQQGGAAKSIANYAGNQTHYGGIAIYPAQISNPQDLAFELEMAAG